MAWKGLGMKALTSIAWGFFVTIGVGLACCFLRWVAGVIHLGVALNI